MLDFVLCTGYKLFFRWVVLETSYYLKDDCLKLNCTLGVVVSTIEFPRFHSMPILDLDLGLHFGKVLEKKETSDVTFVVDKEKFHAHKLV